eukprot:TRINITY_DN44499_c0_g1_i1.p1 TRINITY_DN44499_c0_g1~~TRINITY_DN44499_c0_g1_i1.p1  ORF type:complete len:150 (+),score=10.30 TRINITY_DN44499_c0_g1_i1:229-678(+)
MVQILLKAGAKPDVEGPDKQTALHCAAAIGNTACVKLLVRERVRVNAISTGRRTPLFLAAMNNHAEASEVLLEARADTSATTSGDWTALDFALQQGHDPVVAVIRHAQTANLSPREYSVLYSPAGRRDQHESQQEVMSPPSRTANNEIP